MLQVSKVLLVVHTSNRNYQHSPNIINKYLRKRSFPSMNHYHVTKVKYFFPSLNESKRSVFAYRSLYTGTYQSSVANIKVLVCCLIWWAASVNFLSVQFRVKVQHPFREQVTWENVANVQRLVNLCWLFYYLS